MATKKYKFTAEIHSGRGGGAYVLFPYEVEKEFGTNGRVPVQATLDGVPETTSLIKYGSPQHMMVVLKAVREKIGKSPGDRIEVVLWKDDVERVLEIPAEFEAQMKKEKLLPFFEKLSYTHRKEYCRWLTEAKKEDTRQARLVKAIDMLRKGIKTPG